MFGGEPPISLDVGWHWERIAIRDLRNKEAAISVNAVACHAKVVRKSIYNHHDLLERIRA